MNFETSRAKAINQLDNFEIKNINSRLDQIFELLNRNQ